MQLEYSLSESDSFATQGNSGFSSAGSAALASGESDVMKDLNRYPEQYLAGYFPRSPSYVIGPNVNEMDDATLRVTRPLLRLPGGR